MNSAETRNLPHFCLSTWQDVAKESLWQAIVCYVTNLNGMSEVP